jgi:hypothetical protein
MSVSCTVECSYGLVVPRGNASQAFAALGTDYPPLWHRNCHQSTRRRAGQPRLAFTSTTQRTIAFQPTLFCKASDGETIHLKINGPWDELTTCVSRESMKKLLAVSGY